MQDKTILAAWYIEQVDTRDNRNIAQVIYGKEQKLTLRLSSHVAKARKLLQYTKPLLTKMPPIFYKNKFDLGREVYRRQGR